MSRTLPVLTIVLLLAAYGVAEGLWTDRWSTSPARMEAALDQAPGRLSSLPRTLGPWQGEDEELDANQIRVGDIRAHVLRRYVHATSGESLTVLAVCGQPEPIVVHTPEACYGGAGFTLDGAPVRHRVAEEGSAPAEFWVARFRKDGALPDYLRIYYGWNGFGSWEAPDNPWRRFVPARVPLFKLYVIRQMPGPDEPADQDPIPGFLKLLLPPFARSLSDIP